MVGRLAKNLNLPKFWPSGRLSGPKAQNGRFENISSSQNITILSQNNNLDEKDYSAQNQKKIECVENSFQSLRCIELMKFF